MNATGIGVAVKNGILTLAGLIPSYWGKFGAERATACPDRGRVPIPECVAAPFSLAHPP
ncbi:MAG: hypothetical protein WB780_21945 [Candidatus Acidiferrales bacterium]